MKKVSVIIPCYNGEKFIAKCIESILHQTRLPDETLVIDDGSTDRSALIIERFDVKLIKHKKNKGLAVARNTGIKNASGDILVFVDTDSYADPKMIESLLEGYTAENVVGVGGQGIESNIRNIFDLWRRLHASQSHGEHVRDTRMLWGLCSSYLRDVLVEVGGFASFFRTNAEDVDIGIRITKKGYHLVYVPNAKVYHQRTDNFKTLCNMRYNWDFWGFLAWKKNGEKPLRKWLLDKVFRSFRLNLVSDLVQERNPILVLVDAVMFIVQFRATIHGFLKTSFTSTYRKGVS